MSRGGEADHSIAVLKAQVLAASAELAGKGGLAGLGSKNSAELNEQAAGAIGAILLMVSVLALMTDYPQHIIAACVFVALCLAGYVWLKRKRLSQLRKQQWREHAASETQEDANA